LSRYEFDRAAGGDGHVHHQPDHVGLSMSNMTFAQIFLPPRLLEGLVMFGAWQLESFSALNQLIQTTSGHLGGVMPLV
jgi:hypothetical protein